MTVGQWIMTGIGVFCAGYLLVLLIADGIITIKHKLDGTPLTRDLIKAYEKTIAAQDETISRQREKIRGQIDMIRDLNFKVREYERKKSSGA